MKPWSIAPLLTASLLCGCAGYPPGYAELYGSRYKQAPIDTYPVLVAAIDGRSEVRVPVVVTPGPHKVTVQGPPTATSRTGEERSIDMDIAPCTRYWLVAVKPNRLANEFDVKIDYQEPINGCH